MPRYAANFTKTNADSVRQIVEVLSSATVQRIRCYGFSIKNKGTESADVTFHYSLRRVTASATGTSLTPNPISPSDAACRGTSEHIITADHSSFNSSPVELWGAPCNNRATYQIFVPDEQAFEGAASSGNGLSLGLMDASTSTFAGTLLFIE